MTDTSLEIEVNELKKINLNTIESRMNINDTAGDLLHEIKKKNILMNIKDLNLFEHQEIFKIIKKYSIKYSKNNNGVFINMNKLSKRTINEVDKFIRYCNSNKKIFQKENIVRKNLKEFLDKKISHEKKEETIGVHFYQDNEKIEKGISYQSDNSLDDLEEICELEYIDCSKILGNKEKYIFDNEFDKKIIEDLNMI
tara:strand:+ start:2137 stop:2727 length:591 start_codon:yes stop_codon:yes gene_type:complete